MLGGVIESRTRLSQVITFTSFSESLRCSVVFSLVALEPGG
jgi:hypothetical protein